MLAAWDAETPGRVDTIARALADVRPSQLADTNLFDFLALGRRGDAATADAHAWLAGEPAATDARTAGGPLPVLADLPSPALDT